MIPIQFTFEEVRKITSYFQSMQTHLNLSGDYPEKAKDDQIKEKLLSWLYTAKSDINVATRGPENSND